MVKLVSFYLVCLKSQNLSIVLSEDILYVDIVNIK